MAGEVFVGAGMLATGILLFKYAYEITRMSERRDAIGSTTRRDYVEPAGWKVTLTRMFAVFVAFLGSSFFLIGLF